MYKDFEDLRDNCPASIKASIAIDFQHDDPATLAEIWPSTADGEFRIYLVQRVSDYWEKAVRSHGGNSVPEDGFAIDIMVDSYQDPDMGHSLYLELYAYCGTAGIGDLCWSVFDDAECETGFMREMPARVIELLKPLTSIDGLTVEVEVSEVEEQ